MKFKVPRNKLRQSFFSRTKPFQRARSIIFEAELLIQLVLQNT
jgi:hypothetical protein